MASQPPGSDPRQAPDAVARDLAAIEERLKTAQAELEAVTRERREALDRLGRLHADRVAEQAATDAADADADEQTTRTDDHRSP
jgi:hypothetical protein